MNVTEMNDKINNILNGTTTFGGAKTFSSTPIITG
jgi:hypothetical protein